MGARGRFAWLGVAGLLLAAHGAIFLRLLPNASGRLGHDYMFYLPALLDGAFWFHVNGFAAIPWFTPSFCGGSLAALNINNGYYTVPQLLAFAVDPVAAVRIAFVLFAGLGLLGAHGLLRGPFRLSRPAALLGAGLFLFNGFYAHRMLVGHLQMHAFMLVPLIAWAVTRPLPAGGRWPDALPRVAAAALGFAYMLHAGMASILLPTVAAIAVVGLLHGFLHGGTRGFLVRLFASGALALLLCLAKLVPLVALIGTFSRSHYQLPGAGSPLAAAWLLLRSLALSPALDPHRSAGLSNVQWAIDRQEWEYDLTPLPLLLVLLAALVTLVRGPRPRPRAWSQERWLTLAALLALLLAPIAVNTYTPAWNALLKRLPLIQSSSNLFRWTIVYLPGLVVLAALALERLVRDPRRRAVAALGGLLAVVALNAWVERGFYERQTYDPEPIVRSHERLAAGAFAPEIREIALALDVGGRKGSPPGRNDLLVHGASQLLCYEPMFGYRQEAFPVRTLHPGPVLEETGGVLNLKNPACYVWPGANACTPGDHFRSDQRDAAAAFARYRPFPFRVSAAQEVANWINGLALLAVVALLAAFGGRAVRRAALRRP